MGSRYIFHTTDLLKIEDHDYFRVSPGLQDDSTDTDFFEDTAPIFIADPVEPAPVTEEDAGRRTLTAWKLAIIGYYLTCGGPFGIEPSIGAAGPLLTYISFLAFPILWSLPQAVMAAELALIYRENGGNIVWVQNAFGDLIGWINSYNNLGTNLCTQAITVQFFVGYLFLKGEHVSELEIWIIRAMFVALVVVVNLTGLGWVSKLSLLFMVLMNLPFIIEAVAMFVEGEVTGGKSTFLLGVFGVIPLNVCNYMIPLLVGYSIDPDYHHWQGSAHFTQVASIIGPWLRWMMVFASALSNFGMVNGVANIARNMWAMAKPKHQTKKLPTFIYSWSFRADGGRGEVRPAAAIIIVGLISLGLSAIPYDDLIQLMMLFRIPNLLLEYAALIRLKFSMPDYPREFSVPLGIFGAMVLPLSTLGICVLMIFFAAKENWKLIFVAVVFNIAVAVVYFLFRLFRKLSHKIRSNNRKKAGIAPVSKNWLEGKGLSSGNSDRSYQSLATQRNIN